MEIKNVVLLIMFANNSFASSWQTFGHFVADDRTVNLYNISSTSELNENLGELSTCFQNRDRGDPYCDPSFHSRFHSEYVYSLNYFYYFNCNNIKIKNLSHLLFQKFTELQSFAAINVQLEEINRDDFKFAENLQTLNLSRNSISRLDNMLFLHCKSLKSIDLSKNEINWIHENAFEGLGKIFSSINLSFNKMSTFKEDFIRHMTAVSKQLNTLNVENNGIVEIVRSNKSDAEMIIVNEMFLSNNILKRFDSKIYKVKILKLDNNNLTELFISSDTNYINAENNKITKFKCDNVCQLETVLLSGNKLQGIEVLNELKNATKIIALTLSESSLQTLSVDIFANFAFLQSLRLDKNAISEIDYGLFAHQSILVSLNLSYNAIKEISFHKLATLSSLTLLDISGNKISNIDNYNELKKILPNLISIGLEGNNWNCEYLSKMKVSLASQGISIMTPSMPIKNASSIAGIQCTKEPFDFKNIENVTLNDKKIEESFKYLVVSVDQMKSKITEMENNKINSSEIIFGLQRDILDLKSENIKNHISNINMTNTNEVRLIMEQMNNMTLEKQKLAIDQLIHKINEQNVEISKYKMETEKLFMNMKVDAAKNEPQSAHPPSHPGNGATNQVYTIVLTIIVMLLIIFGIYKIKNFFASNFQQISRQRISRRNSINTVTTFDNSVL